MRGIYILRTKNKNCDEPFDNIETPFILKEENWPVAVVFKSLESATITVGSPNHNIWQKLSLTSELHDSMSVFFI